MANDLKNSESVFADATDLYGTKLNPVPTPKRSIGIDTDGEFYDALINGVKSSMMDISKLESFTQVSQNRELLYEVIDTMCEDTTIASALEIYTEDSTELSDNGRIVWCQSDDEDVLKYVTYLLDVLKNMEEDEVVMKMTSSISPCFIEEKNNENAKYLVLPVRVMR